VHSVLELTLLLLAAAVAGVVLFRFLSLPPMLAYLAIGALVGPHGLGVLPDDGNTRNLADFGVVFLMFSIGLEFSLPKLRSMRRTVFGLGLAQVGLTVLAVLAAGIAVRTFSSDANVVALSTAGTLALGGALAMSSTAIVLKLLAERRELDTDKSNPEVAVALFALRWWLRSCDQPRSDFLRPGFYPPPDLCTSTVNIVRFNLSSVLILCTRLFLAPC